VPPFLKDSPKKQERDVDVNELSALIDIPPGMPDMERRNQSPEKFTVTTNEESRQLLAMRYIYFKVRSLTVYDEAVLQDMMQNGFCLKAVLPLPDIKQGGVSYQLIKLNTYEPGATFNEYYFNSTSAFNFRVTEETLSQFIDSNIHFQIAGAGKDDSAEGKPFGEMKMNKLIMAENFEIDSSIDLYLELKSRKGDTDSVKHVGQVSFFVNL